MKKYYTAITAIFLVFIGIMMVICLLSPAKTFSDEENRTLQTMPKFSVEKLKSGEFTKQFENYIADQFPKRNFFVGVKSRSELLLGKKENNNVYRGKDGYLMQKFVGDDLKATEKKMEYINNFLKDISVSNKYFMLVPTSVEINRDKLPYAAPAQSQLTYINEVESCLNSDVKFIDVYSTLYSKKNEYIYYKTDHHWTTDGAYYAYQKFCQVAGIKSRSKSEFNIKTVTKDFYGTSYSKSGFKDVKPDSINIYEPLDTKESCHVEYSDNKSGSDTLYSMDSLKQKDKYGVFLGGNHSLVKIKTWSKNNKKIVVIRDSYANCFVPFLASAYSEIYLVDMRYYDDSVSRLISANKIDDILFLYNASTFAEDDSIQFIE
ncbi:hypothetical protein Cpap_2525 [Ruminiclostridium papyrosolvens DSM 2782]|uniref:DHHW protein n=1 Tax=Ruminiclostridium papyrosolvens DSM 2782 TaxID=588581 RepID=F1TBG9_9FIRM|nr:DHHW family protein [Ruminiclostridium papyrosolvens]EGD48373.1 hypothetical protein Cpap_2525 [Ruminiclostridium papyrosolvens DSM 2782]WES34123.1 DHHW family protein [Ruminiclostridium papyrosolvens DSM 2782]